MLHLIIINLKKNSKEVYRSRGNLGSKPIDEPDHLYPQLQTMTQ